MPEWPIYQAEGYNEVFMHDHEGRLRWFPNDETLVAYGYSGVEPNIVPISWFYDKPMVESIQDVKTGECYPPEETPNYEDYRKPTDIQKLRELVGELDEISAEEEAMLQKAKEKLDEIKKLLEEWEE